MLLRCVYLLPLFLHIAGVVVTRQDSSGYGTIKHVSCRVLLSSKEEVTVGVPSAYGHIDFVVLL